MSCSSTVGDVLHRMGIHPNRWLADNLAYSRFMGSVWPQLLVDSKEEFAVRRELLRKAWWPQKLRAPIGRRLLVISPHPDDESVGPGGLLLAHRGQSEIHLVCLTDGERGGALEHPPLDSEAAGRMMATTRREEMSRVAKALRAKSLHFCELPDGQLSPTPEAESLLSSIIKQIEPDVVLLPWFLDNHADHRSANVLYAAACSDLDCLVLGYEIWSLLEPNAIFDITDHVSGKLDLVREYTSQLRTVNYIDYAKGMAQTRAFHFPVNSKREGAVEAFVALPNREYCELVAMLLTSAKKPPPVVSSS